MGLDLLEAIRPVVEDHLWKLLADHAFSAKDFAELPTGNCRIGAALARSLGETASTWAQAAAPLAEHVAKMLARGESRIGSLPTRLTQANRSAAKGHGPRAPRAPSRALPAACRTCGLILENPRRSHCDECLPERRTENHQAITTTGHARLAQLRAEGDDPSKRPEVRDRMGRITTAGVITEFIIPSWSSEPFGITAGPDGHMWITQTGTSQIGALLP